MDNANITNQPLTLKNSAQASPSLLRNEIDSRIVKVRPAATPLDQISRMGSARKAGSMKVEYYAVETKPYETTIKGFIAAGEEGADPQIIVENPAVFAETDTFIIPALTNESGAPTVCYVVSRINDRQFAIRHVGGPSFSELPKGATLVRMGRAATELAVQTPQFQALPAKSSNLCQIFKAQIEESTLHRLSNKEVGWTFSDQEEVAVIDMRMGMEKNFLFGTQQTLEGAAGGEDVYLTGGIWHQTDNTMEYDPEEGASNPDKLALDIARDAFRGGNGSRRKILLAGGDLIDLLNRQQLTRVAAAQDSVTRWGIDFTEICSKFGRLYVVHSDVFDQCGFAGNGMVIDPEYLTKYSFIPMQAERLDLKKSGARNTDAIVITEASCLVLRYPKAHLRIIARP